ncbi:MAG: DUF373 family protein, partial [Candidatus Diapherotrites archaeon]|nr:DUF373 family protein [Candidatus Diapherotrites archaeon]
CIDRDDDIGKKVNIRGPIIGRKANLEAATKLILADPGESDANCIFAAVKTYDELKRNFKVEIATLTGHSKHGLKADEEINKQLEKVLKKFNAKDFVLVTDGKEDEQVIPLLQSRGNIFSKQVVIIKQAQAVESTYYTLKEAVKDPYIARLVFGVPGIILLIVALLGRFSLQIIGLVFGIYLLLKGFGIEEPLVKTFKNLTSSISVQRVSFPLYIGSIFILAFGIITAYYAFITSNIEDLAIRAVGAAQTSYLYIVLAALCIVLAKAIDAIHLRRAYLITRYIVSATSVLLAWFILDVGTAVFLREADLNLFLASIIISLAVLLVIYKFAQTIDITRKPTKLALGLPVYSHTNMLLGYITKIDKKTSSLFFRNETEKEEKRLKEGEFKIDFENKRVIASSA